MNEPSRVRVSRNLRAASLGVFLVLAGVFFIVYPLADGIRTFLGDLRPVLLFDGVYYPAPSSSHPFLYLILRNLAIAWSLWLGLLMILQLWIKDRTRRVAHTLGDWVFWVGTAYLFDRIGLGTMMFGSFLALLVVVAGLSLIGRALALLGLEKIKH